jgi:ResB-like family
MLDRIFKFFSSLKLTVVLLGFAVVLVFLGSLAQVDEGLYQAQSRWFRSFFVWWGPEGARWKVPFFPGGYLIGTSLLANLIAAHIKRFQLTWKKLGINVTHAGIILLLVGQLATDVLSRETHIHFVEGETKKYSEGARDHELAFLTDASKSDSDEVVSIPESLIKGQQEIRYEKLPFVVRVKEYHVNSRIRRRAPMVDKNAPPATRGVGTQRTMIPLPEEKDPETNNYPSAVVELINSQGSLGSWLVSSTLDPQEIKLGDKTWRIALRGKRHYLPYTVELLKTTFEVYSGTSTPKNFQSRIRIENAGRGENREVEIYMNHPLRYEGLTFYQYQMGADELRNNRNSSTLMVVQNPGWITPYVGCIMVAGGMAIQFLMHLVGFVSKRRTT